MSFRGVRNDNIPPGFLGVAEGSVDRGNALLMSVEKASITRRLILLIV